MMSKKENIRLRILVLAVLSLLFIKGLKAQQDPMFTQYMFNLQTINPAYAGTWQRIGFMALRRQQWVGVEGAPTTNTFSFQMPLLKYNMGLGLNLLTDRIGYEERLILTADYAYMLKLNSSTKLWMGLKGGLTRYAHDLSRYELYPDGIPDRAFEGDVEPKLFPNVGLGFFLQNPLYYVGLSAPRLIDTRFDTDENNFSIQGEFRHFFLSGGYVFDLNSYLKFKPTFLTKLTVGAPVEFDLSANFLIKEKFWFGAMYRIGDSFGFIAQWVFDNNIRIGYSVDFSTTNLRLHHFGSHEIMISYELKFLQQDVTSPRYF
jgi:type IX secretion system PorP/SprF family membrane protein